MGRHSGYTPCPGSLVHSPFCRGRAWCSADLQAWPIDELQFSVACSHEMLDTGKQKYTVKKQENMWFGLQNNWRFKKNNKPTLWARSWSSWFIFRASCWLDCVARARTHLEWSIVMESWVWEWPLGPGLLLLAFQNSVHRNSDFPRKAKFLFLLQVCHWTHFLTVV